MRLEGKVALISGGAGGMGQAMGRVFTREGAKVVLADVLDDTGQKAVRDLREGGYDAIYVHLDVTKETDWDRAVAEAVRAFGRLDVLVNGAGISGRRTTPESDLDNWNRVMNINSTGVYLGTKAVVETMKKAGGGAITNISSIAGIIGMSGQQQPPDAPLTGAYAASKGAVRTLTKATAIQLAPFNIRVNSVHPGAIDTPMTAVMMADPEARERQLLRHPIGRIGRPEDIAYAILYLSSDEAAFVTGAELVVDGGYTAQ
jgi:NAD(P)-dependent dehydrogenase (short-subunit alcohol dehydrogenase family)